MYRLCTYYLHCCATQVSTSTTPSAARLRRRRRLQQEDEPPKGANRTALAALAAFPGVNADAEAEEVAAACAAGDRVWHQYSHVWRSKQATTRHKMKTYREAVQGRC